MSKFAFVIAAVLLVSSIPARAEQKMVVDMKKLTCSQLTKLGFQDFAGVTMWLSGYYNSSIRNTVVDLEQFARAATKVKGFCQTNARATVLSATERALGSGCRGTGSGPRSCLLAFWCFRSCARGRLLLLFGLIVFDGGTD